MSAEILEAVPRGPRPARPTGPTPGPDGRVLVGAEEVTVRLVRDDEHTAVADLLERAYSADYAISAEYRASLRDVAARAAEHDVWVAVGPGRALLGSVATPRPGRTISPLAQDGELDFRLLGVDPAARGRGVGRRLTEHVVGLARERGLARVVMSSGPRMLPAHRLYAALGFRRLPERETRVVEGGTLLAFGLDLDADPSSAPFAHRTES